MKTRLLATLLLASGAAFGATSEFDRVVKAIESRYGAHRTYIPLLGVANFFVKVIRPAGTSDFHLAVFEDMRTDSDYEAQAGVDRLMDGLASGDLHPMVRAHSRRDGESTYILTGDIGRNTKMLIVTFERNEAVVVQVTVNMETLMRTINDPRHAARRYVGQDGILRID